MLSANAVWKHRLFACSSSFSRLRGDRYRLLRIEQLDARLLFAVGAPSVPLNLINGVATTTALPPTTTFVDLPADVAPPTPANTAQTAFPTPDMRLSNTPGIPIPVVVPDTKGWVFQAGGGGFVAPPIDNASGYEYPIVFEPTAGGNDASLALAPAIDKALSQFPGLSANSKSTESSAARQDMSDLRGNPDLVDAALASVGSFDGPTGSPNELPAADSSTLF